MRNPRHRDAQLLLAELLLAQDDAQGAYGHAEAALDACPNDAQVQYAMGVVMDALGQRSDALGYTESEAPMDPHNDALQAELKNRAGSRPTAGPRQATRQRWG